MLETKYDCCVIGGGMVGAALALGLAKQSYKVALIEKKPLDNYDASQEPDIRISALNMHSVNLLNSLGAWQHVLNMRYRPYDTLSVWDAQSGRHINADKRKVTKFTAAEVNTDVLGYFVENRLLQLALYDEIKANWTSSITCIHDQSISDIDINAGMVTINNTQQIHAHLIFGADGANSHLRKCAGIPTSGWQYSQKANAVLIKTEQKVPSETWQAFYADGPRALLPMHDHYACLIWYHGAPKSKWIQQASKDELKAAVISDFPDLLGEFDIVKVAGFPLTRMHAKRYGQGKAIIVGDAAHTINPLAGQGVNLGFKDVDALLSIIQQEGIEGIDTPQKIITQYEGKRKAANLTMMTLMDVIYHGFSNTSTPLQIARNIGLRVADNAGPVKQLALKYAMGLM